MECIYYDKEKKEVYVLLGYGRGNHLSVKLLKEIVADIVAIFPDIKKPDELVFLEVNRSSECHKYFWYTHFHYVLKKRPGFGDYWCPDEKHHVFSPSKHIKGKNGWPYENETIQQIIYRLIND